MNGNNGSTEYKVVLVGTVKSDLRRFHEELMLQGSGNAFLSAMQTMHDRLRKDPRGFGESLYRLPALKCVVQQGIILPLVVTFAIHDELPLVFVHVVKLLSSPQT